jgi:hypothetical protein
MNFKEVLAKCQEFGFNEEITREMLWNEAYRLGRSRWYWGPAWMVSLQGWLNTKLSRLRKNEPGTQGH